MAETAGTIKEEHFKLAVDHGELREESNIAERADEKHIRGVFRKRLEEVLGQPVSEPLSVKELAELTRRSPTEVGAAFLRCATTDRLRPHNTRKYYQLAEIEVALTRGMSHNVWLNKTLEAKHVLAAARKLSPLLFADESPDARLSIKEIVTRLQGALPHGPE